MLASAVPIEPPATPSADWSDQNASVAQRPIVLDVRNSYEWDAGHFEGAERPVEDEFRETPREGDGEAAVPVPLRGVDPNTPVMVRF